MNKNLKRIVAMAIAVGTISAAAPAANINFLATEAYASTTNDTDTLDSLKLETSSGNSIKLYSDNDYASDNKVDSDEVEDGETYYAKTSSSTINIDIDGPSNKYVKVFKGTSDSAKGKSITSNISLSSGTTTLTVRVYSSTPDSDIRYDDDSDVVSEYVIKVKCTASNDDNEDEYDDIYLDKLSVNGDGISLSDSKTTYNYSVDNDVTEATIKAVPPDEDDDTYTVKIDGDEVNSDDKFKNTVDLNVGVNSIKIKLEDDSDEERDYTLKITRASSASTSATSTSCTADTTATTTDTTTTATSTPSTATTVPTAAKVHQWVQINGGWQYYDDLGQMLKSQWFFDKSYQKWYYLGSDGMMIANGWILTGGKYYYLGSDGAMVTNATINGYKIGSDGAWTGR